MYLTDEVVLIIAPHVAESSDVDSYSFECPKCPTLRMHKERCPFPVSEKAANKVCGKKTHSKKTPILTFPSTYHPELLKLLCILLNICTSITFYIIPV